MKIVFHKNFEKQYAKLSRNFKQKFQEKIVVFLKDPFNPLLNNHVLTGRYGGYRSINISGDLRAIYKYLPKDIYIFVVIANHSNLYK